MSVALAQTKAPVTFPPLPTPITEPEPPRRLMPEHEPLRLRQEAIDKLLREPIKDSRGRIKYIVLLDENEIKNVKDKGTSKKRIDTKAQKYHDAKTKETIAQMEDELGIEAEQILSTLLEGLTTFLDVDQKAKLTKDKRVKRIEQDSYLSYSGTIWNDSTNASNEITPWGVKSMGGPFAIGAATYNNKIDDSPVFVLDSGVHSHIDLNLVAQEAVAGNALAGCYAHATFVAGIIGAMDGASRPNVALASAGATASASSTYNAGYSPSYVINGERRGYPWGAGGGWNDATVNSLPDWVQVNFSGQKTIDRVSVYSVQNNFSAPSEPTPSMTFSSFGLTAFYVEYWTGSAWAQIPGASVSGNNLVIRTFTFAPVTTDKIRVTVTAAADGFSRITEIEAFSVPVSAGVVGVRPGTPIHSVAFLDASTLGCAPLTTNSDVYGGMERARTRVMERCQNLGDCRPGIANLSTNSTVTSAANPTFTSALAVFTQQNLAVNYPGSVLIHSAGNSQIPASGVVISGSSATDGYLRVGALDQNGQQVRRINDFKGFANGALNFNGDITFTNDPDADKGSNHGYDVDVWAPGRAVRSTTTGNQRGYGGGTSFSAPHITALAAKLREGIANYSTPGQLESLVRSRMQTNVAYDSSNAALYVAHINLGFWRALPTVELYSSKALNPTAEHPSKPQIAFQSRTDQPINVAIEGQGASHCTDGATWNGEPWFNNRPVVGVKKAYSVWLANPGVAVWTFRCFDVNDINVSNTATATITSVQAPAGVTGNWYVQGQARTWLIDGTSPTGTGGALVISRSPNSNLGEFTLQFSAGGATSCSVKGYYGGYQKWSYLVDFSLQVDWYTAPIAVTGNNWGLVGLNPGKYSWEATCSNGVDIPTTYATHVTVQ